MTAAGSITVRRSLGRRLKAARVEAGKTWQDVATAHIASRSKLHRIENEIITVRVPDVEALCRLYRLDDVTTAELVKMAASEAGRGWWEDYGDALPSWFHMFVELESVAAERLSWDPELVNGLLQTPDYQRAIFETSPDLSAAYVEQQIAARTERQRAVLDRDDPLRLVCIAGPGALLREVGGPEVMAAQRQHLVEMSTRDHVTVLVLPWSAGAHVAMKGSFNVLGFHSPDDPDVLYVETDFGGRYAEHPDPAVGRYRAMFDAVRTMSIPIREFLQ